MCSDTSLLEQARRTLETLSGLMAEHPRAAGQGLLAADAWIGPAYEIVFVDGADADVTDDWIAALHQRFVPNKVIARRQRLMTDDAIPDVLHGLLAGRTAIDGKTTAYVCQDTTCGPPITSLDELFKRSRRLTSRQV